MTALLFPAQWCTLNRCTVLSKHAPPSCSGLIAVHNSTSFLKHSRQSRTQKPYLQVQCSAQAVQTVSEAPEASDVGRFLASQVGLHQEQLLRVKVRCPNTFQLSVEDNIQPVVEFLEEVGLSKQEQADVITRFPCLFTYGVKAHLKPQLAYLKSLGVPEAQMAALVISRPLVLGNGIDSVVTFLKRCGMPRSQMYRLLGSYPLDFCLRFRFETLDSTPAE